VSERSAPQPGALVWATAAMLGAGFLALIAYELLRPRDLYTGSNSAGTAASVAPVSPGHRLCVRGLAVPAGTGRVEVKVSGAAAPVTVDAVLRSGGRDAAARAVVPPGPGPMPVDFAFARPARGPPVAAARLCLVPREAPVSLWGRPGLQSNQIPPTLDGRPQPIRVAVWFRPPVGERHSLLSQLPRMGRRAALFRPGIVGPWTYWLLLGLTPLLALAGVWMLARAAAGRPPGRQGLAVGAIAFALATSWALIAPAFDAPDETEHIAYVQNVAENGRAPETKHTSRRPYSSELTAAFEGEQVAGFFGQSDGRPPWLARDERRWASEPRRSGADGGGINVAAGYTPLYYAAVAPAYLAAQDASIWSRITLMRLVSALLGAIAAAATFLMVRELLPRHPWAATAGGLLVAFQPMFTFISGAVNNDAAANAAAAVLLLLLVRALRRGLSPRVAVAIGVTMVLLPLAKSNGFFLYPAAAVGLAGVAWRHRPGLRPFVAVAVALGVTFAAWVPASLALDHDPLPSNPGWYAANANEYPSRAGAAVSGHAAVHHPVKFAEYLWEEFLPRLPGMDDVRPAGFPHPGYTAYVRRGWASFGFLSVNFPGWVYALIAVAVGSAVLLGVVALVRERAAVRRRGWELAVLAVAVLVVWVGSEAVYFTPGIGTLGVFGRYLFLGLPALAALAVGACFGGGRRWAPGVAAAAVVSVMALQWASQLLTMSSLYA
jgi:4-amino-4-deoxy-L-arabinose transferase-like glycosyltransferase